MRMKQATTENGKHAGLKHSHKHSDVYDQDQHKEKTVGPGFLFKIPENLLPYGSQVLPPTYISTIPNYLNLLQIIIQENSFSRFDNNSNSDNDTRSEVYKKNERFTPHSAPTFLILGILFTIGFS